MRMMSDRYLGHWHCQRTKTDGLSFLKNILIMLMFNSEVGCEGFDRMYVVFLIYCYEMTDIKLVKLV